MLTIIIPVLNEEKTITNVINFCKRNVLVNEIIVVDDKSEDNTVALATSGSNINCKCCKG